MRLFNKSVLGPWLWLIVCLGSAFLHSCRPRTGRTFYDEEGRFEISFPDEPQRESRSITTPYGSFEAFSFVSNTKKGENLSYEVHYYDYTESLIKEISTGEISFLFDDAQDAFAHSELGRLTGEFNVRLLGYPGREYRWRNVEKGIRIRFQCYLVKNRLYTVALYTKEVNASSLGIEEFFDSFKLRGVDGNPDYYEDEDGMVLPDYTVNFPGPTEVQNVEIPDMDGTGYGQVKSCKMGSSLNEYGSCMVTVRQFAFVPSKQLGFSYDAFYEMMVNDAVLGRGSELQSKKGSSIVEWKEWSLRNVICKGHY